MDIAELKDLSAIDTEGKTLKFDPREESEIININHYASYYRSEERDELWLKYLD